MTPLFETIRQYFRQYRQKRLSVINMTTTDILIHTEALILAMQNLHEIHTKSQDPDVLTLINQTERDLNGLFQFLDKMKCFCRESELDHILAMNEVLVKIKAHESRPVDPVA